MRPDAVRHAIAMGLKTLLFVGALLALVLALGLHARRAQAAPAAPAAGPGGGDLHGLARLPLPRGFVSRGLAGADPALAAAEQLERHDEREPLVFRYTRDPHNDWGGHARDPELLNVVLLPPATEAAAALRGFSVARYFSPRGDSVPLASPRWQDGGDARYRWRVLALDDAFGSDHAPRWAISMLDPQRRLRLDYFVWRQRTSDQDALALLRGLLDATQTTPALASLFGGHEQGPEGRRAALRERNLETVFGALATYGLGTPGAGETRFAAGVAAWLDSDRGALRVQRMLASVALQPGAARDAIGRPLLPLVLKAGQYPGPTIGGLPALDLTMLYWNPTARRWQLSELQRRSTREADPLLPFHQAIVERLERQPGARDAVHLVQDGFWYQPPALDDAREAPAWLRQADRWQAELRAGRIVAGTVLPAMLR